MKISKKQLIYIIFGLTLFFIATTFFYFQSTKKLPPSKPEQTPVVSSLPNHPQQGEIYNVITEKEKSQIEKDQLTGKLITLLPVQKELFSLEYNYDNNVFTVKLEEGKEQAANEEFIEFLKQNSIDDQNWLYNLKTESK